MPISPWVAGQSDPIWTLQLSKDGGDFDISGQQALNISILFYSNVQTGVGSYTLLATGGGQVTIISGDPGIITYRPIAGDTSGLAPGQYWIRVRIMMNGTNANYSDYISLVIQA